MGGREARKKGVDVVKEKGGWRRAVSVADPGEAEMYSPLWPVNRPNRL